MTPEERKDYIALGHTGPGWLHIIERLDDRLSEIDPNYDIDQIKQKFGGLRYYFGTNQRGWEKLRLLGKWGYQNKCRRQNKMYELVEQAMHEAWRTCECCGTTDSVTTNPRGCIQTLCKECRDEGKF